MVKTLHARAATRDEDFDDVDEGSEPNMKLSHAFVVVLLLHILAVGGVFAFNSLKSRHSTPERAKPVAADQADTGTGTVPKGTGANAASPAVVTEKTPAKNQPSEVSTSTYTVVAGDTLHRIAAAQKTTVEAIEQANGIESNTAIRVGQVLKIPTKGTPVPAKPVLKTAPVVAKTAEAKPAPVIAKPVDVKPAPVAAKTTEAKPAPLAAKPVEAKPVPAAAKTVEAKPVPVVPKANDTPAAPVAKTTETAAAKPVEKTAVAEQPKAAASEKTYTVAKGDNPYSIAKKLKVSYNDLIKANSISDPTKLQIGQKLMVP